MSLALLIAGVLIVVVLMTRSARRAWKDHHSLRAHHKTLDALGEVAHHQDSAIAPIPDPALIRAHVRVVKLTESGPSGPPRPTRPQPTPPAVAAGLVADTIDAPILSRPLHRRRRPPRARWLVARHRRRPRARWLVVAGIAMAGVIVAAAVALAVTGAGHAALSPGAEVPAAWGRLSSAWG